MNELMNEQMKEWMNEWMNKSFNQNSDLHKYQKEWFLRINCIKNRSHHQDQRLAVWNSDGNYNPVAITTRWHMGKNRRSFYQQLGHRAYTQAKICHLNDDSSEK